MTTTKLRPPAIVIVGEAVRERASVDWFASRPLAGQTVMVTRPVGQADALADRLADLGAGIVVQPAIRNRSASGLGPSGRRDRCDQ